MTKRVYAAALASICTVAVLSGQSRGQPNAAFNEAFERLTKGRTYSPDAARGIVQGSRRDGSVEYFYTLDVPESYDARHRYPVRVQLHGGVDRMETSAPRFGSAGSVLPLPGRDEIR